MKKLFIIGCLFCGLTTAYAQELSVGDAIGTFELHDVRNGKSIHSDELKGKAYILDFWATWCAPCISAMSKLEKYQQQYKDELQIIAISHSDELERVERFVANKDFNFTFAHDADAHLRTMFPYRSLSHLVWVDQAGIVRAITGTNALLDDYIKRLVTGEAFTLPVKQDNVAFDYSADYFNKSKTIEESFEIQPGIQGVGTFMRQQHEGFFDGRRISMINFTIPGMYREAYQMSSYRITYEVDKTAFAYKTENMYCLDIIVKQEDKDQLREILKEKVAESFDYQARMDKKEMEVLVLYDKDSGQQPKQSEEAADSRGRGDGFRSKGATMDDFAAYIEDFGLAGMAVLNDSQKQGFFDIDFTFEPENPQTFHTSLAAMGLAVKKEVREVEVLVIYQ